MCTCAEASGVMVENGKTRILVVDDDEFVRRLLTTVVNKAGYEVETAGDGAEALEKIAASSYSLILLDLMMPRVDGVEVLREMERGNEQTPVIVMTAADESLISKLPQDRVKRVMRKPFDVNELIETIRDVAA